MIAEKTTRISGPGAPVVPTHRAQRGGTLLRLRRGGRGGRDLRPGAGPEYADPVRGVRQPGPGGQQSHSPWARAPVRMPRSRPRARRRGGPVS